jgi:osmotically-inducible protein OsmY
MRGSQTLELYFEELCRVKKHIVMGLICTMSLTGCASFVSSATGTAPVGTESGARSLGQVFIDSSIVRTAKINLYKLDHRFKQSRINIESFHGHVLLTGQVPDAHLKTLAEDNVRAMSDVKAVHNYITVGNQIGYNAIMHDTLATANTKGLIMKAEVISASKVLLHTEDDVLYIMGKLNSAEIEDLNHVLSTVGNVSKIVTLIDNVEHSVPTAQQYQPANALISATATPVAIDPESN